MAFQQGGEVEQAPQQTVVFQQGGEVQPTGPNPDTLFEQLGGRLPAKQLPFQRTVSAGMAGPIRNPALVEEEKRRGAFSQLVQQGFSPRQIDLSLQTQKTLEGPRFGKASGGLVGAAGTTAALGRFIPGPFDDAVVLGALAAGVGAGVGGAVGEAVQTGIQEKRLISRREALSAFATELGTEVAGRGLVGGGKLLFSPLIKKTLPEAAALVDDFAKVGGTFSATELDDRFSLQVGESFARGATGAKKIFHDFEKKQGKAVVAFADNIVDSIGEGIARQTPEEIGQVFAEGISRPGGRVFNMLDEVIDPLYRQVDDLTEAVQVPTKSLKDFARKHIATDKRLNGQFLSDAGRSKLTKLEGLADNLSFSDMRTLRSSFLKDVSKMARDVDQSQGIIKQLAGITDKAIFDPKSAKGLSQGALTLLRNTNSLYRTAQEGIKTTFSETLSKRLLKNPSSVIKEVFPNKNPKSIRLLRQSLIEPISGRPNAEGKIAWNQLRQAWLADAVEKSTEKGVANANKFSNIISKAGKENLKEMFPEPQIAGNVRKIQNLFETAGKAPPGGYTLLSRGGQVLGLKMMYDSGKQGDTLGFTAGATLAIGPILTAGFKLKPGASGLVPNAVRAVRVLREIDKKEASQRRRQRTQEQLSEQDLSNILATF
jgi:hypothetical protein